MLTRRKARELAIKFAILSEDKHGYLPQNKEEGKYFIPHQWVIDVIIEASKENKD